MTDRKKLESMRSYILQMRSTVEHLRYIESIGRYVKQSTADRYNKLCDQLTQQVEEYAKLVEECDNIIRETTKGLNYLPFKTEDRIRYVLTAMYRDAKQQAEIARELEVSQMYVSKMVISYWDTRGDRKRKKK